MPLVMGLRFRQIRRVCTLAITGFWLLLRVPPLGLKGGRLRRASCMARLRAGRLVRGFLMAAMRRRPVRAGIQRRPLLTVYRRGNAQPGNIGGL